ncbi:MAG: hypothetical protein P9M14_11020 [Candidatus Alcyoniella australis]|nr:hypothetical protein [Candidatus Alcyoniella australis]
MKSKEKIYKFHVKNLRSVESGMLQVARSIRKAISKDEKTIVDSFTRLFALLLGVWSECRLCKLTFEPNAFNDIDIELIYDQPTQIDKWQKAIELAFRKHYKVPRAALSDTTLPHSVFARYTTLIGLLENDLKPIIELRNKLAHGQWIYPLNYDGNDIAQKQMDALRLENLLSLQYKAKILSYITDIVNDLAVSESTFDRDFDKHYSLVIQIRTNLSKHSYCNYERRLKQNYNTGRQHHAN